MFPVALLICAINITIKPSYVYKCDIMDNIIAKAKDGWNATNVSSDIDERLFKKKYVELYHDKNIDYLILGSSRLMTVSSEAVNGMKVLNLAISGAKIEDLVAIYQASIDNNIHADNVIIGVDPLFFNSNYGGDWWKTIAEYYYEFTNTSYDGGYQQIRNRLFSIDYFRKAITAIQERPQEINEIRFSKNYIHDGFTRRHDGSIYYPKSYRKRGGEEIDEIAKIKDDGEYDFDTLSLTAIHLFELLIKSIQSQNSKVTIICCPYHPIFYQRITQRKCIQGTYTYLQNIAKKRKITIVGNYNPQKVGFNRKDFYDEAHPQKESLDNLISFLTIK